VQSAAKELKAVLVVDEITSGWRLTAGGAHQLFGLEPDIAVFAKGMSNGYPMAAIIGKKSVMDIFQQTFVSSTYWTERIGPVAAMATIKKIVSAKVPQHLNKIGKKIKNGWQVLAKKHGINIHIGGIDPLAHFTFEHPELLVLKTLFTQEMLKRGFLANTAFYVSFAHKEPHIRKYLKAVNEVFAIIAKAQAADDPKAYLEGPVAHAGFKRLT
jgi:glutamate-1-semialdehyde aminotransferase